MKYTYSIGLLAVIAIICQSTVEANSSETCTPGTLFKKGCKECVCPPSGDISLAPCTKIYCPEITDDSLKTNANNGKCVPGELFQKRCNECVCPPSGLTELAPCTRMYCPEFTENKSTYKTNSENNEYCVPGVVFKKGCNECVCPPSGNTQLAPCTRKYCPEVTESGENFATNLKSSKSESCTPGEVFKKRCNNCVCPPSGVRSLASCTLRNCPESSDRCVPGDVFTKECNKCICSFYGLKSLSSCTLRNCREISGKSLNNLSKTTKNNRLSESCVPGEVFKKGCNDCVCPPTGVTFLASCTLRNCPNFSGRCVPGEVFKKGCNECVCPPSGNTQLAPCTRKYCPEVTENGKNFATNSKSSKSESCVPGEVFKRGCNDCVCPPSGVRSLASCTLRSCPGFPGKSLNNMSKFNQNYIESKSCVPGEVFKRGCNDCVCPPSGIQSLASCTLKNC